MRFSYRCLDASGVVREGVLAASSQAAASQELERRNLRVLLVLPLDSSVERDRQPGTDSLRLKGPQLALFVTQLAVMLKVGIHICAALECLGAVHRPPAFGAVADRLRSSISQGRSLSEAMSDLPGVFRPAHVKLVRVGETTGALVAVLGRLGEALRQQAERRGQLAAALIYPAFVLTMSALMVAFLVSFMVPRFLAVSLQAGSQLPWPTRALLALTSTPLTWLVPLVLVLLAAVWWLSAGRTPAGRILLQKLVYEAPLVGPVARDLLLGELCRDLALFLGQGVSLAQALDQLSQPTTGYYALDQALREAGRSLSRGEELETLWGPFFPPMMVQLISTGQAVGKLPRFLSLYSEMLAESANRTIRDGLQLLEPLVMAGMGLVVGVVVVASLLPMYSLLQAV